MVLCVMVQELDNACRVARVDSSFVSHIREETTGASNETPVDVGDADRRSRVSSKRPAGADTGIPLVDA